MDLGRVNIIPGIGASILRVSPIKIFHFTLILLLFTSSCLPAWGQVIHENPNTATPSHSQSIDDQVMSLLENMMGNLDDVSVALNNNNFTVAKESYARFSSLLTRYEDLAWRLNLSESDYKAISSQMNLTNDQIRTIIDESQALNDSVYLYNLSLSPGNESNASLYAARIRDSYSNISLSYSDLRRNASILEHILSNSSFDYTRFESSMSNLGRHMYQVNGTYYNLSIHDNNSNNISTLLLIADWTKVSVGDTIIFYSSLKDVNGTPISGKKVQLYIDGRPAGSFVTDTGGEGSVKYIIPLNVSGDLIYAQAEYFSSRAIEPIIFSNYIEISVNDLLPGLSISLDRNNASFGDTVNITGELAAGGQGMPLRPILIFFNNSALASITTDKKGSFAYAMQVGPSMPEGTFSVYASYNKTENDLLLNASSPVEMLNIAILATRLTFNSTGPFIPGSRASLVGSLTAGNDTPVPGAIVSFYTDDMRLGNGTTGTDGAYDAVVTFPINISPGNHTLYAAFDPGPGKSLMAASSPLIDVLFQAGERKITMNGVPQLAFKGDNLTILGTLRMDNGMPIPGEMLSSEVLGAGQQSMVTGPGGDFNISYAVTGNDSFGWSTITVKDPAVSGPLYSASVLLIPYDWYLVVGALLIILGIVAGLFIYLRSTVRRPESVVVIPRPADTSPVVPAEPQEKPIFRIDEVIAGIRGEATAREAMAKTYASARKALSLNGLKLDDSMTHHEVYHVAEAKLPRVSHPLKEIVRLYEKAVYANRELTGTDIDTAVNSMREIDACLNPGGGERA